MLAINYKKFKDNIKKYFNRITDNYEVAIIVRKNGRNIIMMSEESYNNIVENNFIMGNKANYEWLIKSKNQLDKGVLSPHALVEEDYE